MYTLQSTTTANQEIRHGDYSDVLSTVCADLIFTSPPYNIGSKSPAKIGKRNAKTGEYDPKSYRGIREYPDNLPEDEYQDSQNNLFYWMLDHLAPGGTIVYNHKPRRCKMRLVHPLEWILVGDLGGKLDLMEEIVWDRGSTHNHSNRMMWQHTERLYVFKRKGDEYALRNTSDLDYRSDVWRIGRAPVNGHNAPFPEALARGVVNAWSRPGQMVCDPYSGSGTTAVAARDLGRNFVGAELLEKYHASAMERLNA